MKIILYMGSREQSEAGLFQGFAHHMVHDEEVYVGNRLFSSLENCDLQIYLPGLRPHIVRPVRMGVQFFVDCTPYKHP